MARQASATQQALTIVTPLRVAGDRVALANLLRRHGAVLESLTERLERSPEAAERSCFDAVGELHFLAWFIVEGENDGPPSLVMEASFDGPAREFLARFVSDRQIKTLLDEVYAYCEGYADLSDEQVGDYLWRHNSRPGIFYVGCPGHATGQIREEEALAATIARHASRLGAPRGRRFEYLRRIWAALSAPEKVQVCGAPAKPFWVRYVLREHKLKALLVLIGLPLGLGGLLTLLFMALHACGVSLWDCLVPPPAVAAMTVHAAWIMAKISGGVLFVWLLLLAFEAPKDLTPRMRLRVVVAKTWEMVTATFAALPAGIILLGIVALLAWQGRLILEWIKNLSLLVMLCSALFAMILVLISLPEEPGWKKDRRQIRARLLNLLIAGIATLVAFLAFLLIAVVLKLYGGPVAEAYGYPLLALLAFAGALAVGLVLISQLELGDKVREMSWTPDSFAPSLRKREDLGAQNHFVSVTDIKPGRLRALTLRIVLCTTHYLAQMLYDRRGLAGIPSIHFARWQILQGGRRLLFAANYDGGWGGYLGDFVAFAAYGINAIWGNTGGFPRPFYLFADGVTDEQRFKFYARATQVETLLWFRRYPHLTVAAIKRNAAIRDELARFSASFKPRGEPIPEADLDAFLRRFAAPGS
jgi:hypothetical protein